MKMVHLRFENARLFPQCRKTPKNWVFSAEKGKYVHQETGAENFGNPITVNIVANVMRTLTGDIPVPTLKPNDIGKNPLFEELAGNAFVRYDAERTDEKGRPMFTECMNVNKSHVRDSHSKKTQEFELFDSTTYVAKGNYDWYSFEQTFSNGNPINKESLLSFISEIIDVENVRKLTFREVVYRLSEYWHTEDFENKVKAFFDEKYTTNAINGPWSYVLFGCTWDNGIISREVPTGSNGSYKGKTPLLYTKGIAPTMYVSGDIYCPVTDEMIECLSENMGTATILDGGIAYVAEIEIYDENRLFYEGFSKILNREDAISLSKTAS